MWLFFPPIVPEKSKGKTLREAPKFHGAARNLMKFPWEKNIQPEWLVLIQSNKLFPKKSSKLGTLFFSRSNRLVVRAREWVNNLREKPTVKILIKIHVLPPGVVSFSPTTFYPTLAPAKTLYSLRAHTDDEPQTPTTTWIGVEMYAKCYKAKCRHFLRQCVCCNEQTLNVLHSFAFEREKFWGTMEFLMWSFHARDALFHV